QLSLLLRKNPPPWGTKQTEAVKALKKIAQAPPALKIPENGKRILQTDASDCYWGAVLIEEVGNIKFYCGHASGQFKEAEKHYHTTYKEALVVKLGIQKFDFHLRGFHFEVRMDNFSFPKILEFKNKMPPDPQTLRLK
ncbi:polyprotein-like, partial [Trifolium medium]|nr:polyprotein-like [Trifolium medium]